MKNLFFILFSFLFFSLQAQYRIDWKNAPLNPNAINYTLNHYKLLGPVKVFIDQVTFLDWKVYNFNENGRVSNFDDHVYKYDNDGLLIGFNASETTRIVENNAAGFVISDLHVIDGKAIHYGFEYNKNGLLSQKTNLGERNTPIAKYYYDSNNRINKYESYVDGKIYKKTTYKYIQEGDFLKVMMKITGKNGVEEKINYFDAKGNNYGNTKKLEQVVDDYGNRLYFTDPVGHNSKLQQFRYYPKK